MDILGNGKVSLNEFQEYMSLIIRAINKVHPGATDNLLTEKEITLLFCKISSDKEYFDFSDFELVYNKKPELLSWIDYFKNNDEDVLYFINSNIKYLFLLQQNFFTNFHKLMSNFNIKNIKPATEEIDKYIKSIKHKRKNFILSGSVLNIRTIFENLSKAFNRNDINNNINHKETNEKSKFAKFSKTVEFEIERNNTNDNNINFNNNGFDQTTENKMPFSKMIELLDSNRDNTVGKILKYLLNILKIYNLFIFRY
jgi:hypothetical protein